MRLRAAILGFTLRFFFDPFHPSTRVGALDLVRRLRVEGQLQYLSQSPAQSCQDAPSILSSLSLPPHPPSSPPAPNGSDGLENVAHARLTVGCCGMCACVQDARIDKKRLADIALLQSSTLSLSLICFLFACWGSPHSPPMEVWCRSSSIKDANRYRWRS